MMPVGWKAALLGACLATAGALWLQNVLRDVWQIRTLPERVMEWLLLFVPLDLFERGLAQLGANGKQVALLGTTVGMLVVLVAIGVVALGRGLNGWQLLGLGIALWSSTMVVVMPVTGAGLFATGLLISPFLTSAGYLLVFVGYASVLIGTRLVRYQEDIEETSVSAERRALLTSLGGVVLAGAVARIVGHDGGLVSSSLPLAAAPAIEPAAPPPSRAVTFTARTAQTIAGPTSAPLPTQTLEPMPNPPPPRQLARDKDGSLTAAGRPKGELSPTITANEDFYVVTKNAVADPTVDAATWRLVIDGEVNHPVQVDYRTLRALPWVELTKTLECISNFTAGCNLTAFGCELISTALWKGARLRDVVNLAGGLKPGVLSLAFVSVDEFSAGLPPYIVHDLETLVAYEMNGEPLPREHGFPARLIVPGRYGMKNPKWLSGIRAMSAEYQGWYEQRNWNKDGIVKTMARIDLPVDGTTLAAGDQRVAGIAYAGNRGISKVEFTTDGATWRTARLLESTAGGDAMVRWEGTFPIARGELLTITVRATDRMGAVQTEEFQLPQPDGASGRASISVSAA